MEAARNGGATEDDRGLRELALAESAQEPRLRAARGPIAVGSRRRGSAAPLHRDMGDGRHRRVHSHARTRRRSIDAAAGGLVHRSHGHTTFLRTGTCNVEGVSLRRGARKWRAGRSCVHALAR